MHHDTQPRTSQADSTSPLVPRQLNYHDVTMTPSDVQHPPLLPTGMPWAPGHDTQPVAHPRPRLQPTLESQTPVNQRLPLPSAQPDKVDHSSEGLREENTSESTQEQDYEVDFF